MIDYYKVSSDFIKKNVIEAEDISGARSNMLILYQTFAKIIADIHCMDYTEITNSYLHDEIIDAINYATKGDFFTKIKGLKKIGVSSFGVTLPYKANSDVVNNYSSETKRVLDNISSYNPIDFDEEFIENLFEPQSGMGSTVPSHETKDLIIAELLTAILLDQAAHVQYVKSELMTLSEAKKVQLTEALFLGDYGALEQIMSEYQANNTLTESKIQEYLVKQTGLSLPGINNEDPNDGYASGTSAVLGFDSEGGGGQQIDYVNAQWVYQYLRDVDPATGKFRNKKLGELGNHLIHKRQMQTSQLGTVDRYVLPLETKDMTIYNSKFINGHDFYMQQALSENDFEFAGNTNANFMTHAEQISGQLTEISEQIIKKLSLDYTNNINSTAGINDSGEYSSFHMFRKICLLIAGGIDNIVDLIENSEKELPFKYALELFLLILSGENKKTARNFGTLHFWSNNQKSKRTSSKFSIISTKIKGNNEPLFYKHIPPGTAYLVDQATSIAGTIIQNILGQTTVYNNDRKKIFKGPANVVPDALVSNASSKAGLNQVSEIDQELKVVMNAEGDVNNIWYMSLLSWCNESALDTADETYSNHVTERNSQTGMKYDGKKSVFLGPFGALDHTTLVENIFGGENTEEYFTTFKDYYTRATDSHTAGGTSLENAGKSHGPIGFNASQIQLVLFFFVSNLLSRCCEATVEIRESNVSIGAGSEEYEFKFDKRQLQGVAAALRGELTAAVSESENGLNSYNIAVDIINKTSNTINKKSANILNRIKGLMSISNDIVEVAKSYRRYFDFENNPDQKLKALRSFLIKTNQEDMLTKNYQFMNSIQRTIFNKNIDNFLGSSKNQPLFSNNNNITDTQLKLMTLALSRKGYGYHSDENGGKKTLLNIGIPAGLFDYLRKKAYVDTNASTFLNSNFICLQIFKNSLSPETVSYYPKTFVFDMRKFTIENNKDIQAGQVENYQSNWTYLDLQNNFTFINYNNEGMPGRLSAISIINGSGNKQLKKQMVDNHIADHYLKIYQMLTLGVDMNEYAFPTDPQILLDLKGIDSNVAPLFDIFEQSVIQNYPSANIDDGLRYEYDRVKMQIKDSIFFKAENKAKLLLTPKCFDRVFSVMINENDFLIDSSQLAEDLIGIDYQPMPSFTLDNKILITESIELRDTFPLEGVASAHQEINAHKKNIEGSDVPTINQYFCNISILRSF
jgi:hypothetical protein